MATIKTEGCALYYALADEIVKNIGDFNLLTFGGDKVSIIDRVAINKSVNTKEAGKLEYGPITFGVNLEAADHKALDALRIARQTLSFVVALSDGNDTPSLSSGVWAATRSIYVTKGFISELVFATEDNALVTSEITIQPTATGQWQN